MLLISPTCAPCCAVPPLSLPVSSLHSLSQVSCSAVCFAVLQVGFFNFVVSLHAVLFLGYCQHNTSARQAVSLQQSSVASCHAFVLHALITGVSSAEQLFKRFPWHQAHAPPGHAELQVRDKAACV